MIPEKAFGAVFLFDENSSKLIKNVWQQISSVGLSSFLIESSDQPHLSLSICKDIDCDQAETTFKSFVASIEPFSITLPSIGIFPSTGVVYYGVTVTEHLVRIHRDFTEIFKKVADTPSELYFPGSWVPHVTLAYDLPEDQISKTVEIVRKTKLPITCSIERIALIEFPPWKECVSCDLRHCLET